MPVCVTSLQSINHKQASDQDGGGEWIDLRLNAGIDPSSYWIREQWNFRRPIISSRFHRNRGRDVTMHARNLRGWYPPKPI